MYGKYEQIAGRLFVRLRLRYQPQSCWILGPEIIDYQAGASFLGAN
jgi:hypothetical protein